MNRPRCCGMFSWVTECMSFTEEIQYLSSQPISLSLLVLILLQLFKASDFVNRHYSYEEKEIDSYLKHAPLCTHGCSMRQQPQVQPKGLTLLLCILWAQLHLWGWDEKSHSSAQNTGGAEQSLSGVWNHLVAFGKSSFPPALWTCALPVQVLLFAVVNAGPSLYPAHRLSSTFWKTLCMNGLFLETSLIDVKTQEKLHPRCFCYDSVVFSGNTWH